jgi:hypothetical protein
MPIARARQRKKFKGLHRINLGRCSRLPAPCRPIWQGGTAAASKPTSAQQQTPRVNSAGMVWVNTDSGVYLKPGTPWYGKTKQGKHDRSRRPKSRLSRHGSGCPEKEIELVDLCATASRPPGALIFSRSLFAQNDFAVAHELIVQPQTVLVRCRFASGARGAAE